MFKKRAQKKLYKAYMTASKRYSNFIVADHRKDSPLAMKLEKEMKEAEKAYISFISHK